MQVTREGGTGRFGAQMINLAGPSSISTHAEALMLAESQAY